MYVKYAVGGFTVGYQISESDHDTKQAQVKSQLLMVLHMQ